jgi:hypothetical protein
MSDGYQFLCEQIPQGESGNKYTEDVFDDACALLHCCSRKQCRICVALPLIIEYKEDGELYDDWRRYTLAQQPNDPCPCPKRLQCAITFDKSTLWYRNGVRPASGRKQRRDAYERSRNHQHATPD